MVKRFQETKITQAGDLGTGAAPGLLSLSQKLDQFGAELQQRRLAKVQARSQQEGIATGQALGEGDQPAFREIGFIGSARDEAFNNGLRSAYVAGLNRDMREEVSRISAENPDNLVKFNDQMNAFTSSILKNVDPTARTLVFDKLDSIVSDARTKVQGATIKRQSDEADQEHISSIEVLSREAMILGKEGNSLGASEALVDTFAVIDARVESGRLDVNVAQERKRELTRLATVQNIRFTMDTAIASKGIEGAIDVINAVGDTIPTGFSVDEQDELVRTLSSDLNRHIALENKVEQEQTDNTSEQQENNTTDLFLGVLDGTADADDVIAATKQKQISFEQATKLVSSLQTRGQGVDDWALISDIQSDIRAGVSVTQVRENIIANTGSRLTEASGAALINDLNQSLDKESILQTNRSRRAEDFITQSMRVTGPFGALDFESEQRLARTRREYSERVLDGEDPFEVADDLINKDEFLKETPPKFGTKDNLDEALKTLDTEWQAGNVDDETYDAEVLLIQRLKQLKSTLGGFDAAKKEALSGQ